MQKYQVILVAGGSCSGKSEFAKWFRSSLLLDLDRFYYPLSQVPLTDSGKPNFDTPEAINIKECAHAVEKLSQGEKVEVPTYSFITNNRSGSETLQAGKDTKFIVVEGLYTLYSPLKELGDLKVFLDTPAEIRVARRMLRDIERKKVSKTEILSNFVSAEEGYQAYIEPTKKEADLVIPFSNNPFQFAA